MSAPRRHHGSYGIAVVAVAIELAVASPGVAVGSTKDVVTLKDEAALMISPLIRRAP